jgi:hypothetical protein
MAHILKFIGPENAFDPETVALLSEAYDKAIGGMDDQGLPAIVCEMIAKRIMTAPQPIKPTSTNCHSAWQPNPGRDSTYRSGKPVQTTGATSILAATHALRSRSHFKPRVERQYLTIISGKLSDEAWDLQVEK